LFLRRCYPAAAAKQFERPTTFRIPRQRAALDDVIDHDVIIGRCGRSLAQAVVRNAPAAAPRVAEARRAAGPVVAVEQTAATRRVAQ